VNCAVETEQPLTMSGSAEAVSAGLGYIDQAGLSGSREKAYMAYRRARPGQARSERIWTGRARLYRSLAGLARWEH